MHRTPTLNWKGEIEVIKRELNVSITKLIQTNMNPFLTATCCNNCVAKSVHSIDETWVK